VGAIHVKRVIETGESLRNQKWVIFILQFGLRVERAEFVVGSAASCILHFPLGGLTLHLAVRVCSRPMCLCL
jgi:hypothetical protein